MCEREKRVRDAFLWITVSNTSFLELIKQCGYKRASSGVRKAASCQGRGTQNGRRAYRIPLRIKDFHFLLPVSFLFPLLWRRGAHPLAPDSRSGDRTPLSEQSVIVRRTMLHSGSSFLDPQWPSSARFCLPEQCPFVWLVLEPGQGRSYRNLGTGPNTGVNKAHTSRVTWPSVKLALLSNPELLNPLLQSYMSFSFQIMLPTYKTSVRSYLPSNLDLRWFSVP